MQRRFAPRRPSFSWPALALALVIFAATCSSGTADESGPTGGTERRHRGSPTTS